MCISRKAGLWVALSCAVAVVGLAAGPASAAVRADPPDLVISASFDKTSYKLNDACVVTWTIKNVGAGPATNVHTTGGDRSGVDGGLTEHILGLDLAPGEQQVLKIDCTINDEGHRRGSAGVSLEFGSGPVGAEDTDADKNNNIAGVAVKVVGSKASLDGKFYHETDNNTDTIEPTGVAGAKIAIFDVFAPTVLVAEVTSESAGNFKFTDVPAGDYTFRITAPAGWAYEGGGPQGSQIVEGFDPDTFIPLVPAAVQPTTPTPAAPANHAAPILPDTGSQTGLLSGIGVAILAAGVGLVLLSRSRRNRTHSAPATTMDSKKD